MINTSVGVFLKLKIPFVLVSKKKIPFVLFIKIPQPHHPPSHPKQRKMFLLTKKRKEKCSFFFAHRYKLCLLRFSLHYVGNHRYKGAADSGGVYNGAADNVRVLAGLGARSKVDHGCGWIDQKCTLSWIWV